MAMGRLSKTLAVGLAVAAWQALPASAVAPTMSVFTAARGVVEASMTVPGSGFQNASVVTAVQPTEKTAAKARPSFVVIVTDDQRSDTVTPVLMPNVYSKIVANGITFSNAFVSNPLCCPSRASILTGNFSHTTGVFGNSGAFGGFDAFTSRGNDESTIATDLASDGYRTALVGKYLNGYRSESFRYIPPGWSRWFAVGTGSYFDYEASDQGVAVHHQGDYVTTVLKNVAVRFIKTSISKAKPYFLYFSARAPHAPATPGLGDIGRFSADPTTLPDYGTVQSTKPAYVRTNPWSSSTESWIQKFASNQLNSTYAVDRAVGRLWHVSPKGTVFVFLSDNGTLWGEHRWHSKQVPYDASIRVPMAMAVKGTTDPSIRDRIVLNVDIRPTLTKLAGVEPSQPVDGIDMLGRTRRSVFVLEHWNDGATVPTYCGYRSATEMYVRYATGEEELYDEIHDPAEVYNLASTDPVRLDSARSQAEALCRDPDSVYPDDWPFP